ncbi:amidohydrolase family protein [Microlunatus soli]|uniref:Amidohydrolase-related domain-containing protein n=1 Tax=Microlunatus soli TaxID=630515 RepID=A0A1H1Z1N3_9ACTN|nr:amidohydrolase family protein [Microlunatus soli]SDT27509.1 hypothetical protein SAMN04489812_4917 [Microlunatus soli]
MIVDVHCHTPTHVQPVPDDELTSYPSWRNDRPVITTNSWEDFDRAADAADVAIVFNIAADNPLASTGLDYRPEDTNTATAAYVAARPRSRIGFMSVNPSRPGLWEEVERARAAGLVGVKLGANYQEFEPLSDDAMAFYRYCEAEGLPILFHQGASPIRHAPLRYTHPLVTDEIAIACPELRIVMAHMGHPFARETVVTIRKHPHVYADVSSIYLRPWVMYESLLFALEWGAAGKLLLGSDFPIATTQEAIDGLHRANDIIAGTAMPRIPDEVIDGIVHADALGALGLQDPRGQA